MTYISKDFCWFFDLGGSRALSLHDLQEIKRHCFMKKVTAFISHFDKDHIQFYRVINQTTPIDTVYVSHLSAKTIGAKKMFDFFQKKNISIKTLNQGERIKIKDTELFCLWPKLQNKIRDENSKSLTLLLKHKKKSILLTGDLSGRYENALPLFNYIDILKVAHHGSGTSTGEKFLNKIKAKACIISVGQRNKYGHPKTTLLDRLKKNPCAVLRTDRLGSIRFYFQ